MFSKFLVTARPWQKFLVYLITYLTVCIATLVFLLCIAAFTITRIDTPDYILIPLTTILLTCSSFIGSFILAKTYKEKGFITGMAVGLIFTCLVTVVSFKYGLFSFNEIYLSKICAVLFAGILGGVVGVNI